MDYKEKYNKLVEAVKELQEANPSDEGIQNWVNDNIPELCESKDEIIKKELINYLKHRCNSTALSEEVIECNKWIAWLEKKAR